jgi:uncharacterized protein
LRPLAAVAGLTLAWGLFESQWVEGREVDVPVPGLPRSLDGFRILHLSDFHLGSFSLNGRALRKAIDWACGREVDVVAITGDLLSQPGGEALLRESIRRLQPRFGTYVVLGNHDVAVTRDPFSGAREIADLADAGAVVLRDGGALIEVGDVRVQLVGADVRTYLEGPRRRLDALADCAADLRILLHHFPQAAGRFARGPFQLVLAGHVHGGQICLPTPWGKVRFGEFRPPYPEGVFRLDGTTLVVSRGTGTAFVPFRFFARPEVTILRLRGGPTA